MTEIIKNAANYLEVPKEPEQRIPITIWVSRKDKDKYDLIQLKTRKSFSKVLRQVIIKSIETFDGQINK